MGNIGGHYSLKPKSGVARFGVALFTTLVIAFVAFAIFFYYAPVYSFVEWAPEQPIPFSHKLHAGEYEINCQYCHSYARKSEMAGVPALSTCMNCHTNLVTNSKDIEKVTEYFENRKPIEWIRIYDLPDHVWFSHKRHIAKDIACQKCHGPVQTLEVNAKKINHKMGFCLNCHRENEASTDCLTCHT